MKLSRMVGVLCLLGLIVGTVPATAQDEIKEVSIKAIRSIQVQLIDDKQYVAEAIVEIQNPTETRMKLVGYEFEVLFEGQDVSGEEHKLKVGIAKPEEVLLDKGSATDVVLKFEVGKNTPETRMRLVTLFNILGNPLSAPKMYLNGKDGEAGTEGPNGWYYSKVRAELVFTPSIQREMLFQ